MNAYAQNLRQRNAYVVAVVNTYEPIARHSVFEATDPWQLQPLVAHGMVVRRAFLPEFAATLHRRFSETDAYTCVLFAHHILRDYFHAALVLFSEIEDYIPPGRDNARMFTQKRSDIRMITDQILRPADFFRFQNPFGQNVIF